MRFAPEYVKNVLNENFEDAKELLLKPLMAINYAHLVMLTEQGIITNADARTLRAALDAISLDSIRQVLYDGTYEDLFFYIERSIKQACDEDVAGRLHTARSRNDIDHTVFKLALKDRLAALFNQHIAMIEALLAVAERERATIVVAYTHGQPAQPTTYGHYLAAFIELSLRDMDRLLHAARTVDLCSMGAAAPGSVRAGWFCKCSAKNCHGFSLFRFSRCTIVNWDPARVAAT